MNSLYVGERPTKLFCSLEKHNGVQKHIPKLIVDKEGSRNHLMDQKSIEDAIYGYYKELFSSKPTEIESISNFLEHVQGSNCPKLSASQKEQMEGMKDGLINSVTESDLTDQIIHNITSASISFYSLVMRLNRSVT